MISISAARRAGVPLVAVETPDAEQTIGTIIGTEPMEIDGKSVAVLKWDIVRGLDGVNAAGKTVGGNTSQQDTRDPVACLDFLARIPDFTIVFMLNAHRFWNEATVAQAIWNLRDVLKMNGSMLILLCPIAELPTELKNDIVVLEDTLPTEDELERIVTNTLKDAKLSAPENIEKVTDTLTGLSAFAAEQALAMSASKKDGVNLVSLWDKKRKIIEQTRGLSVWRGGETFKDIGGSENVKSFLRNICNGNNKPRAIVFADELEKATAGSSTDSSGVSQDQLLNLLTWMQNYEASGMMFVGAAGSGKSAIAKAAGNEAGIPTISLDLGGLKGSLVGESEGHFRTAMKVILAVSQGRALFLATCNSTSNLPPELRRRFSLGTFFFPLPTPEERMKIWGIYIKRFSLSTKQNPLPNHDGWTGAEIKNCCDIAWRTNTSLAEAARYIVPVSISAKDKLDALCREANNRYISAANPGLYQHGEQAADQPQRRRRITQ